MRERQGVYASSPIVRAGGGHMLQRSNQASKVQGLPTESFFETETHDGCSHLRGCRRFPTQKCRTLPGFGAAQRCTRSSFRSNARSAIAAGVSRDCAARPLVAQRSRQARQPLAAVMIAGALRRLVTATFAGEAAPVTPTCGSAFGASPM